MTALYGVVIGLAVVVFLLSLLVVGLLRSHAEILRKLEALGVGDSDHDHLLTITNASTSPTSSTDINGVAPNGEPVVVSPMVGEDPMLIAFLSTSCSSCTPFWEGLETPIAYFGDRRHRVLVTTLGPDEESPTRAQSLARGSVDVVMSSTAWTDYKVPGAPYFVLVDPGSGIIGEGSAADYPALQQFLEDATRDQTWDTERRADKYSADAEREARIDRELRRAGIEPGDPRLYPESGEVGPTE